MKYYIIAGEASGDLHGSNLIKELKKLDALATVRCWGGDLMEQAGGELVKHYRDLAFMGFIEVVKNLGTIFKNLRFCKQDILRYQPDAVILIDYPGFNLRIAEWAKQKGIKVIYYISPQVWAWKESRVNTIRRSVDKMLVILPFEKEFYAKWNMPVEYVGHPLIEVVENAQDSFSEVTTFNLSPINQHNVIALLPGSREQEVSKKLPMMLQASRAFPEYQFIIAKAPSLEDSFYEPYLQAYPHVRSIRNKTYELLMQAKAALVTSGTATLETALFGVPEVVCYKGSVISYQIAKRLVKVKYISLVNLIMGRQVVTELIQDQLTAANIERELNDILHNMDRKRQLHADYTELRSLLKKGGPASANAAKMIYSFLHQPSAISSVTA
ncbi:MAG TPA: lipid-A-disaccharide synthase [Chitinophagaceae bacterium]|nr:lipid-A-disaccharide synthase [Chitinophagaceae bacterium]